MWQAARQTNGVVRYCGGGCGGVVRIDLLVCVAFGVFRQTVSHNLSHLITFGFIVCGAAVYNTAEVHQICFTFWRLVSFQG